jgi:ribonuclease J
MIKKRQEEFPHLSPLTINIVERGDAVTLGDLKVNFFGIKDSAPAEMGIIIETPYGDIVHTGDLRLEHNNGIPTDDEVERYKVFENRKTLLLMADSVGSENSGTSFTIKESEGALEKIIQKSKGKVIIATFSSQIETLLGLASLAKKLNKKVILEGRTMRLNAESAKLGMLFQGNEDVVIAPEDMQRYPENDIMIITAAQEGEEFTSLGRMANKTHRFIKITPADTVIMSSAVTPGVRRTIQIVKDKFSRENVHLAEYESSDLYSSGHAYADELSWIHNKISAKYFSPIHGCHYMLRVHSDIRRKLGASEQTTVIPDNGMIIEIRNQGESIVSLKERAPSEMIVVDGTSVGKIQDVVMRDRQTLAEDGMFVVIGVIDSHTHTLKKSPDLISRGFVYLKESQELLYQTRLLTKKVIDDSLLHGGYSNLDQMKQDIAEATTKFLLQKTAKRPVIIPVIISV